MGGNYGEMQLMREINDIVVRIHHDVAMGKMDELGVAAVICKVWQTTSNGGKEVHEISFNGFIKVYGNVEHVSRSS